MDGRIAVVLLTSLLLLFLGGQQRGKASGEVAAALPTIKQQDQPVAVDELKQNFPSAHIESELAQVDERLQVQEALGQKLRTDLRELENNWAFSSFDDEQLWERFLVWWQTKSAASLVSLATLMDENGWLHWSWPQVFHEQVEFATAKIAETLTATQLQLGDDSAGKLVVPVGSKQVSYWFEQQRDSPPLVFLTQENDNQVVSAVVRTVSETGFVVSLSQTASYPVVINWLAIDTD